MTAASSALQSRVAWPEHRLAEARAEPALALHANLVEAVVVAMHERLQDPWTLEEIARLVHLSPYHFDRTFARVTGVPPFKFLAALRMAEAKRLLLTTALSVTDVCLEVGYRSLGTFTTHFTEMVGISPRAFRRLGELFDGVSFEALTRAACSLPAERSSLRLPLEIRDESGSTGPLFVGAFGTRLPRGMPLACRLLPAPGTWQLPVPRSAACRIFVATLARADTPLDYLLPAPDNLLVARADVAVIENDMSPVRLELRACSTVDPPIVVAFPYALWQLVAERGTTRSAA